MDHERFCANKIRENLRKVAQDIKAEKVIKRVEGDMQEFEKFRFTGTPVIVINGVALHGALTFTAPLFPCASKTHPVFQIVSESKHQSKFHGD